MQLTADDQLAIQELAARYAQCFDLRDVDGWVNCFVTDGIFEVPGLRLAGHAEIKAWAENLPQFVNAPKVPFTQHRNHTFIIEPTDDGARMLSYFTVVHFRDQLKVTLIGRYRDALVKVSGRWRFAHRLGVIDFAGNSMAPTSTPSKTA